MGAILGTALSLTLTISGAAVAAGAGPAAAQNHLAGHVLLGVGIGLLIATVVRLAARIVFARIGASVPEPEAPPAPAGATVVTLLPARQAPVAPLRGRHAA
ncbi:hypothetical protein [Arthrobacter sp. MAHUQ-56]